MNPSHPYWSLPLPFTFAAKNPDLLCSLLLLSALEHQHCWLLSIPIITYPIVYAIIVVSFPGSSYHCCLHFVHSNRNVTGESPSKSLVSNNNTPSWRSHQAAESERTMEKMTRKDDGDDVVPASLEHKQIHHKKPKLT